MTTTDRPAAPDDGATVERLERLLDEWRGRIDELLVQADLASKDVSESVRAQATAAQNAYLAARNQLARIPKDAGSNLGVAAVRRREAHRRHAQRLRVRRGHHPAEPGRVAGGAGAAWRDRSWPAPATTWNPEGGTCG